MKRSNIKNQRSKPSRGMSKVTKLRKGDEVLIVAGKDKGKRGNIDKVLGKIGKVVVLGVNQYKRHLKARSQNAPSEIIALTKPLPIANVSLICPKCKLQTRVGVLIEEDKRIRTCKKCKQSI